MAAELDFNLFHIQGIQVGIQAEVSAILSIWIYRRRKVPQHEHQSPWGRSGHGAGSRDHGSQNIRQAAARESGEGRQPCRGALVPGGHRAPQTGQRLQGESEAFYNNPSHLAGVCTLYTLLSSVSRLGDWPGAPSSLPDLQPARGRGDTEGVPLRPRPGHHSQVTTIQRAVLFSGS